MVDWWCLRRKGITEKLIQVIHEMYQEARTWMRTTGRMSEEFEIKVGLYQGSISIKPIPFVLVLDVISKMTWKGTFN